MNKGFMQLEWLLFIRNKKNLLCFIILLLFFSLYTIFYVPSIEKEIQSIKEWNEINLEKERNLFGEIDPNADQPPYLQFHLEYLEKTELNYSYLLKENPQLFAQTLAERNAFMAEALKLGYRTPGPNYIDSDNPLLHSKYDLTMGITTARALETYEELDFTIILSLTTMQVVIGHLIQWLAFLLFMIVIVYGHDHIVASFKHPTIMRSLPISFRKLLFLKSSFLMLLTGITLILLSIVPFAVNSIRNGIGSFHIPVAVFNNGDFEVISLGQFYTYSLIFIVIISWLLARMVLLAALIVKNQYVAFIIMSLFLFSGVLLERISFFPSHYLTYIPTVYFDFGNVIIGEKAFLLESGLTIKNGLLAIGIYIMILEIIIYGYSLYKSRKGGI